MNLVAEGMLSHKEAEAFLNVTRQFCRLLRSHREGLAKKLSVAGYKPADIEVLLDAQLDFVVSEAEVGKSEGLWAGEMAK